MSDAEIVAKAKSQLDTMLGSACAAATVVDAAVVKLPSAVNWYYVRPRASNLRPSHSLLSARVRPAIRAARFLQGVRQGRVCQTLMPYHAAPTRARCALRADC